MSVSGLLLGGVPLLSNRCLAMLYRQLSPALNSLRPSLPPAPFQPAVTPAYAASLNAFPGAFGSFLRVFAFAPFERQAQDEALPILEGLSLTLISNSVVRFGSGFGCNNLSFFHRYLDCVSGYFACYGCILESRVMCMMVHLHVFVTSVEWSCVQAQKTRADGQVLLLRSAWTCLREG